MGEDDQIHPHPITRFDLARTIAGNAHLQRCQPSLEILAHPLALPVLEDPRWQQPLHHYRRIYLG
jgi:hypothetical protein